MHEKLRINKYILLVHCVEPIMGTCFSNQSPSETLVIWDIENICPPPGIDPGKIIQFIKERYVVGSTHQVVCSMTRDSILRHLDKRQEDELIIAGIDVILASAFSKKRDADYILKQQMTEFIADHARNPTRAKIVLITSDADFSLTIKTALKAGISIQLIYSPAKAGKQITTLPYKAGDPPVIWEDCLTELNNGVLPDMKMVLHKPKREFKSRAIQTNVYELEPVDQYTFEYAEKRNDVVPVPGVWDHLMTNH